MAASSRRDSHGAHSEDVLSGWPLDEELGQPTPLLETLEHSNQRLSEVNAQLLDINRNLLRELEAAASIQRGLLPPTSAAIRGVRFETLFTPSSYVAGDTFNFFPLGDRHVGFYLLDVAGHGMGAALMSIWLSRLLNPMPSGEARSEAAAGHPFDFDLRDPLQTVSRLNECFQSRDESTPYFTMVYCVLDVPARELTLVQAGHPSPLLLRRGRAELIGEGGYAVGVLPTVEYSPIALRLEPGDRLFLYSDGIVECRSAEGLPYSDQHLRRFVEAQADEPLAATTRNLWSELRRWRSDEDFADDVSLLAVEIP